MGLSESKPELVTCLEENKEHWMVNINETDGMEQGKLKGNNVHVWKTKQETNICSAFSLDPYYNWMPSISFRIVY